MTPQLNRYYQGLLLLYLTAGFATLASTGRLPWWLVAVAGAAYAVRGGLFLGRRRAELPARWLWIALALYLPLYAADGLWWSGNWLDPSLRLVVLAGAAKLFATRIEGPETNWFSLAVLAFLEVLAAALLTVSGVFFLLFLLFLGLLIATLVAREMVAGAAPAAAVPYRTPAARTVIGSLLRFSGLLGMAVAGFTVLIFLLLPRTQLGRWGSAPPGTGISGFSDEVRLGAIADLQRSNNPVMHVRLLDANPPLDPAGLAAFPFRGRGLTTFDGERWYDSNEPMLFPTRLGQFTAALAPRTPPAEIVRYQVTLEPMASPVLFFPARLLRASTHFGALAWDRETDTVTAPSGDFSGTAYSAISDLALPGPAELRAGPALEQSRVRFRMQPFLQLPDGLDPRIRTLARTVVAHRAPDPYDRMQALTQYLESHYQYSLDDLPQGDHPLATFLFDQPAGDCEYFASALAVMARVLGIPTRVVNGFVLGAYNPLSGEYVVRGSDAHSWVEAYLLLPSGDDPARGYGPRGVWVPFDATPAAGNATAGAWPSAGMVFDALSSLWQEWIVNYDWMHQAGLASRLQADLGGGAQQAIAGSHSTAASAWQAAAETAGSVRQHGAAMTALFIALLLGLMAVLTGRRRRGRAPGGESAAEREARLAYTRFQRILARAGWRRAPAQTAEELLAALAAAPAPPGLTRAAADFVAAYEAQRFGGGARPRPGLGQTLAEVRRFCPRRVRPAARGGAGA